MLTGIIETSYPASAISDSEELGDNMVDGGVRNFGSTDGSELSSENSSSDEDSSDESTVESSIADEIESTGVMVVKNVNTLKWREGAGSNLKRSYGSGSERTTKRQRRHQRELARAASNTPDITDLFRRSQELQGLRLRLSPIDTEASRHEKRRSALEDLQKLLSCKTLQIEKYGHVLLPQSDFYRRHCMVKNFLCLQQNNCYLEKTRKQMAKTVAATFNRHGHVARKLLQLEKTWVDSRTLPKSKAGKHKASLSWLEDEAVLCAVRDFAKTEGEGE